MAQRPAATIRFREADRPFGDAPAPARPAPAKTALLTRPAFMYKSAASSRCSKELTMNELHDWLASQHPGLRTFKTFQRKLADLAAEHPGQRAMCRLLSAIVGSYVEEFDEAPLPSAVAERAYQKLLRTVAELDCAAEPARLLGHLNRLAELNLAR
jgi:hypothetical protein